MTFALETAAHPEQLRRVAIEPVSRVEGHGKAPPRSANTPQFLMLRKAGATGWSVSGLAHFLVNFSDNIFISKGSDVMDKQQYAISNFFSTLVLSVVLVFTYGCAQPPVVSSPSPPPLISTPDLSAYTRFELFSQASMATGQSQTSGQLTFSAKSSQFDVNDETKVGIGRLHVQPDVCRDDSNPECLRHFTIVGRIQALGFSMNCTVPVRNDVTLGYAQQTLSGICQSQYGRSFTFNMYAK